MLSRSAIRSRHQNSRRADHDRRVPGFLPWLRGRPCRLQSYSPCFGKVRSCHVDCAGGKGAGLKVADRHAIPMCDGHHAEQHQRGWATFQALYAFDATVDAADFWQMWPGRAAWERARAE